MNNLELTYRKGIVPQFQEASSFFPALLQGIPVPDKASRQSFLVVPNLEIHTAATFGEL